MKCTNLHFDGLTDETINQGADFDALEGVKAYDADGNEIDFSVEPEEFDSCAVGEQTLVYKAMGKDNRLIPSMCIPKDSSGANLPLGCTLTLLKENRKITVLQADPPRFTMNDVTIPKNTTLDVLDGVSAEDDNGNPITDITYSGTLDKKASGDIVSITDGQSVVPVKSLKVTLEPIQSGSGTPSPDNVRPISGHTECVTKVCGKNLFGGEALAENVKLNLPSAIIDTTNKTVSFAYNAGDATADVITDFPTKEATQYTIMLSVLNASTNRTNLCVLYTDGTTSAIPMTKTNQKELVAFTSTSGKTVKSINLQRQGGTTVLYYDECGVFEGVLTADQFEPYNGASYTTTLGRTVYGGTLDVVSGELVVDRAMVDLSSLSWSYQSTWDSWYTDYIADVKGTNTGTETPNFVSDRFEAISTNAGLAPQAQGFIGITSTTRGSSGCRILVKNGSTTESPIGQLCYELATPQTYQLDPQTISLLHGNNNVWSDGEVEMVYSVELPTDGEVSYPLEGEYEITYSATDKCGNVGEAIRHITVQ